MLIERLEKKGNDHVANKQTLLGEFSNVGHGGQKNGEGIKNATSIELEKREGAEYAVKERRGREERRMRSPKDCDRSPHMRGKYEWV